MSTAEARSDEWESVQSEVEALSSVVPELADLPLLTHESAPEVLSRVVETAEQLRRRVLRDRIVRASLHELMGALLRGRDSDTTLLMLADYLCGVLSVGEVLIVRGGKSAHQAYYASENGRAENLGRIDWSGHQVPEDAGELEARRGPGDSGAASTHPSRYRWVLPLEHAGVSDRRNPLLGYLCMSGIDEEDADWSPQEIARRVADMIETLSHREEMDRAAHFRRQLLEAMQDGVLALDATGNVLEANAGAVRVLGGRTADLRGTSIAAYQDHASPLVEHLSGILDRQQVPGPKEISVSIEDRRVPFNVAVSMLGDEDAQFRGIVVNLTDLSPIREMEEEIDRLDRLAALGRFAAGIAHEIRNPLAGIGAGVEYLAKAFEPAAPEQRDIRYVLGEVQRLNSIVADLLDYTQPRPLDRSPLLVTDLVEKVRTGLLPLAREQEVRLSVGGPNRAQIWGDGGRIEQVLLNLVRNAIEACPSGGEVSLVWEETPVFRFIVEDEGPGLSEEQMRRAFEPFFTTKGNGTGLGLYLSHSIVEQHGGRLILGNKSQGGARIAVEIPQTEEERTHENALVHLDR